MNSKEMGKFDDKQLHEKFSLYGANAKEWIRKCQLLLPEIARRQLWRKKGFGSIYEYAAKLAGMSRHSVDNSLWVLRKIENKPALQKVAMEKGISRVRPIANIATEETQEFWAKKATEMSQNTLQTFIKNTKESKEDFCFKAKTQPEKVTASGACGQGIPMQEISMKLRPELARKLQQLQKRDDFEELLEKFIDGVEASEEEEKPEPVRTQSRYIPAKIRRFVIAKTGGKCAFPGCNKQHEFLHHTQRFASERVHDPDRLMPLCKAHERIAHLGLIANEEGAPSEWRLRVEADPADMKNYVDQFVGLYR